MDSWCNPNILTAPRITGNWTKEKRRKEETGKDLLGTCGTMSGR